MSDAPVRPPVVRWLTLAVLLSATGALVGTEEPPSVVALGGSLLLFVLLAAGTLRALSLGTPPFERLLEAGLRTAIWPALYLFLGWFVAIRLDSWILLALVPVGLLNAVAPLRGHVRVAGRDGVRGGWRSLVTGLVVGGVVVAAAAEYHGRFHAKAVEDERTAQTSAPAVAVAVPAPTTLDLGPGIVGEGPWRNVDVRLTATLEPGAILQIRVRAVHVEWPVGVSFFLSTDERFPSGFREESKLAFEPMGEAAPVVPAGRPVGLLIAARGRTFTASVDGVEVTRAETRRYAAGGTVIQSVKGVATVEDVTIEPAAFDEASVSALPDRLCGAIAMAAFLLLLALLAARFLGLSAVRTFEASAFGAAPFAVFLWTSAPTGGAETVRLSAHLALAAFLLLLLPLVHRARITGRRYATLVALVAAGAFVGYFAAAERAWPAEFDEENALSLVDWSGDRLEPDLVHLQHPALRRWNGYLGNHFFRLVGHERERAPDTTRVAFVGTSSTHGYWLKVPYPYRLQLLFQKKRVPTEVMVCAAPGSTAARLYWFTRNVVMEYEPDVLVLPLYFNDAYALTQFDEEAYLDRVTAEGYSRSWLDRLRDRLEMRVGRALLWSAMQEFEETRKVERPEAEFDPVARFESILVRYAELCAEHGVSLVFVMEPVAGGQSRLWKHEFYGAMARVGERYDVSVINPTPYMNKEGGEVLFMDEVHPLEVGAQKMAEAILPGVHQTIADRRGRRLMAPGSMKMILRLAVLRRYSAFLGVYLDRRPPVLVYQMGKVGSSSVRNSLLLHGVTPVLHFHSLLPVRDWDAATAPVDDAYRDDLRKEIAQAEGAYRDASRKTRLNVRYREWAYNRRVFDRYVRGGRRADVITLVRDPVAANISMYFQLFREYTGARYVPGRFSTAELVEDFRQRYPHSRPLTWLDAELKAHLGIDVFESPFPREQGHVTIEKENFRLLVLKLETSDDVKRAALEEFLGLTDLKMVRSNVAGNKSYADQYREFRQHMVFPDAFLDGMYGSKYATHFYDAAELQGFRAKWTDGASGA